MTGPPDFMSGTPAIKMDSRFRGNDGRFDSVVRMDAQQRAFRSRLHQSILELRSDDLAATKAFQLRRPSAAEEHGHPKLTSFPRKRESILIVLCFPSSATRISLSRE